MGRMGFKINIDVTKLDKERFFKAGNGSIWADLTVFCDPDEMKTVDDVSVITQDVKKHEREMGTEPNKVGWFKCTWRENPIPKREDDNTTENGKGGKIEKDDDIPF